jgi:hypothetical protein
MFFQCGGSRLEEVAFIFLTIGVSVQIGTRNLVLASTGQGFSPSNVPADYAASFAAFAPPPLLLFTSYQAYQLQMQG